MRELSLFTGAGGGVLGTMLAGHTPIGYVEWNSYCQQVLAARIRDGILPVAPIFTDVRKFVQSGAAAQYRGFADLVTAGFPCQPFSVAGSQLAEADERNMWPATAEVIRAVQPETFWGENVPGLISSGYFGIVLRDLAEMGYSVRWGVLGASDVGACHRRKRLWILANAKHRGVEKRRRIEATGGTCRVCGRVQGNEQQSRIQQAQSLVENAECLRLQEPWQLEQSMYSAAGKVGKTDRVIYADWWEAEPDVGRVANGVANRVDMLRAIGNGQVPAVARLAWELLK